MKVVFSGGVVDRIGECEGLLYHDDGREEGAYGPWIGKFIENRLPCRATSASEGVRECEDDGLGESSLASVIVALLGEPICSAGGGRIGLFGPTDVKIRSTFNGSMVARRALTDDAGAESIFVILRGVRSGP
jgi:hypothetical protein